MTQTKRFSDFAIAQNLLQSLEAQGFHTPTPIQAASIPALIEGDDLVGIAQTGTGKTLAFGIPLIQRLGTEKKQGLIVLPTRELAAQVNDALQQVGKPLGLRTAVVIGGVSMGRQIQELRRNPHVIIGTPGRIIDLLGSGNLRLNNVSVCILDEADRMFDMGFAPQIQKIMEQVPKERQTVLFSATMPKPVLQLATKHMQSPTHIEIAPQGTTSASITQELFLVNHADKVRAVATLLEQEDGTAIVFTRTKHGATKLTRKLKQLGVKSDEIHGDRSQAQRTRALDGFRNGKIRILVATDIAARGIDVPDVSLVLNYDLPDNIEEYVHRIGRTGRAGATGRAVSLVNKDQKHVVRQIERTIKQSLKLQTLPTLLSEDTLEKRREEAEVQRVKEEAARPARSAGGYGGNRGRAGRRGSSGPGSSGNRRGGTGSRVRSRHSSSSRSGGGQSRGGGGNRGRSRGQSGRS